MRTILLAFMLVITACLCHAQSLYDSFNDCTPWTCSYSSQDYPQVWYNSNPPHFCENGYISLYNGMLTIFNGAFFTADMYAYRNYDFKAGHKYVITFSTSFSPPGDLSLFAATGFNQGYVNPTQIGYVLSSTGEVNIIFMPTANYSIFGFRWTNTQYGGPNIDYLNIIEDPCQGVNASISGADTMCGSDPLISITASAGKAYTWSANNGPWSSAGATQYIFATGTYAVYVLDNSNCLQYATRTIGPTPAIPTISGSTSYCYNGSTTLTASVSPVNQYEWNGPGAGTAQNQGVSGNSPGTYYVRVKVSQQCWLQSDPVTTIILPLPAPPTISGSTLVCPSGASSGGMTTALTAVPSGYPIYSWSNGASGPLLNAPIGTYTVRVTDGNGCQSGSSPPVNVTERWMQFPAIGVEPHCGYTVLTAFNNSGNYWSTGEWGSSITVTTSGTYWLENVIGTCVTGPTYASVNILQPVTPSISKSGNYCTTGVVLTASPAGMSYYWSTGETSQSATVWGPGNYSVQVSNGSCGPFTATINVPTRSCSGPPCNKCRVASDGGTTLEEDDNAAPDDAVFYPNPVDKELTIDLQRPVEIKTSIRLVDNMGKVVHQSYFESGESKRVVVTDQLAQGMYILVVANDEHTLINRNIVVNRRQ